jgi:hypothetical protein
MSDTVIIPGNPWTLENLKSATYFDRTTPEWVNANTMVTYTGQAQTVNLSRTHDYNAQFDAYVQQKNDRPDATNIVEPGVPRAQAVTLDPDGTPIIVETSRPVCAKRVYTPLSPLRDNHGMGGGVNVFDVAGIGVQFTYNGKLFTRDA